MPKYSPITVPHVKPVITIGDEDVTYVCSDTNNGTHTVFRANFDGTLTHMYVSRGDFTAFGWNRSDGVFNHAIEHNEGGEKGREMIVRGLEKDHVKMLAYFKTIVMPPFSIRSDRTEDAQIGGVGFTPVANWEYAGSEGFGDAEQIVLKNDRRSDVAIVKKSDFLFPPPETGKFRVGRKSKTTGCGSSRPPTIMVSLLPRRWRPTDRLFLQPPVLRAPAVFCF